MGLRCLILLEYRSVEETEEESLLLSEAYAGDLRRTFCRFLLERRPRLRRLIVLFEDLVRSEDRWDLKDDLEEDLNEDLVVWLWCEDGSSSPW